MEIIERVRPYWAWITAALLVAAALAVVHSTGPDGSPVDTRPGQFVGFRYSDDRAHDSASLLFPDGSLSVELTGALTSADGDLGHYSAPDDGSFVGLQTVFGAHSPYSVAGVTSAAHGQARLQLVVVADGRRYPIRFTPESGYPDVRDVRGYLAVAGRPRDIRVEATVDGIRQTVRPSTGARDAGRAGPLYLDRTPVATESATCAGRRLTAGYRFDPDHGGAPECTVVATARTAYVEGLGWAAPGMVWQVVQLSVDRSVGVEYAVPGRPVQTYRSVPRDDELSVRIGGQPSAGSPRANAGGTSRFRGDALAVAPIARDAPPATVQIVATYHRLRNEDPRSDATRAPIDPDVSVSWTETLS